MNNRNIGIIVIFISVLLGGLVYAFHSSLKSQTDASCSCSAMEDGGICPHQVTTPWQTYSGIMIVSILAALGFYLMLFERTQQKVLSALSDHKNGLIKEDKFKILLMGLNDDEKKVIKSIKEQDGITQQTLRLRTDFHKSKLSIILSDLEKKNLIAKKAKGKTHQVFLKIDL